MSDEEPKTFGSYEEALAWFYAFTDSERTGQFMRDREDNLARERALLAELGNPQRAYRVTHIAGTKGKGSTATLIAAILQAAGIHTGLYTQPDLHTFRERMRVDGRLIGRDEVARLAGMVRDAQERVGYPYGAYITYEVATALAFLYFREAGAQHAVIEVGLGGRLDATNVVEPLVSVITSISYDHMNVLGNTLAEIAGEKAGIIKPGAPVVTSARAAEALAVIQRVAGERGVPLVRVGSEDDADCAYRYRSCAADNERSVFDVITPSGAYEGLELSLLGEHQLQNAAAAVAVAELLRERGLVISDEAIRAGLRNARWPARMQTVGRAPWLVVDSAHNADSFAQLFAALRRHFTYERLILVLGLMADKDIPGIVREIARAGVSETITTGWNNGRAAAPSVAAELLAATEPPVPVRTQPEVNAAMSDALRIAQPHDLICVAGSVAFAGEVLRWCATNVEGAAQTIEIAGVDH
jgi:dihydrofolate synthase/folylpolyglutamate synthase